MDEVFETRMPRQLELWLVEKDRELSLGAPAAAPLAGELDALLDTIVLGSRRSGPEPEHVDWLHYLLPFVASDPHFRAGTHSSFERLVSAFMSCHRHGLDSHAGGARDDELSAVGQCLMSPRIWLPDASVRPKAAFGFQTKPDGATDWLRASPDFCAGVFFCLKYLAPDQIGSWVSSVCAISNFVWRAQWLQWLLGAWPLLRDGLPSDQLAHTQPRVDWAHSDHLCPRDQTAGDFLPAGNRRAFTDAVRARLTIDTLVAWSAALDATEVGQQLRILRVVDELFDQLTA